MEDLSEREQIEVIRSWWKENGTYVVLGIVIGVGGIFGLNQWRSSQLETQIAASTLFEELAEEIAENRLEPAETLAGKMYGDYGATIYADQARLAMARLYMDQGRDEDAAAELQALLDGDGDPQMKLVARMRLAKVYLYQDKAEDVIALLEGHEDSGFAARFNEALGDAHRQLGAFEQAEEAYMAALGDPLASQLVDSTLLQMKLGDLPDALPEGTVITPEGASDAAAGEVGISMEAGETMEPGETTEAGETTEESRPDAMDEAPEAADAGEDSRE